MKFQQRERLWEINPPALNEEKKESKQKKRRNDSPHLEDVCKDIWNCFPFLFFHSHPSFSTSVSSAFLRLVYIDGVKGLGASGPCTCTI